MSMGRTHTGAEEKCEEDATEDRNHYGLTVTPVLPTPPALLGVEGEKRSWE